MFGRKKKKPPKEPDYLNKPVLPNKLAKFVQAKYGLSPEELHKLFDSMARVDPDINVSRRQVIEGKEYPKRIGKILTITEAAEYEKERAENRRVKEEKIHELIEDEDFHELRVILEVNDSIYPQRLAPVDIVRCIDSAGEKLDALARQRATPPKSYSAREEMVLDAITSIKKQEPIRLARMIAARQRGYIFSKTMEELEFEYAEWLRGLRGDPPPETEAEMLARLAAEEEAPLEEERLPAEEAARNFGDLPKLRTLLDDVAELIGNNPEAAAAIISQWIGNAVMVEQRN
jgi:sulfur carrier protein ThiS